MSTTSCSSLYALCSPYDFYAVLKFLFIQDHVRIKKLDGEYKAVLWDIGSTKVLLDDLKDDIELERCNAFFESSLYSPPTDPDPIREDIVAFGRLLAKVWKFLNCNGGHAPSFNFVVLTSVRRLWKKIGSLIVLKTASRFVSSRISHLAISHEGEIYF